MSFKEFLWSPCRRKNNIYPTTNESQKFQIRQINLSYCLKCNVADMCMNMCMRYAVWIWVWIWVCDIGMWYVYEYVYEYVYDISVWYNIRRCWSYAHTQHTGPPYNNKTKKKTYFLFSKSFCERHVARKIRFIWRRETLKNFQKARKSV
jgi:hypothetical protein